MRTQAPAGRMCVHTLSEENYCCLSKKAELNKGMAGIGDYVSDQENEGIVLADVNVAHNGIGFLLLNIFRGSQRIPQQRQQ